MQGIARVFHSPFRVSLIRNNIAIASSGLRHQLNANVPNFLSPDKSVYCCVQCVGYQSRKGRNIRQNRWLDEWKEDEYDDIIVDKEIFEDEGRARHYLMLKATGFLCVIFFLNIADIIRIQLRNSVPRNEENKGLTESVYWKNKGFTGFLLLSIALATIIPSGICRICDRCVRSLWLLKGGKMVRVRTFAPFFMTTTHEVPVTNISGLNARAGQNYVSFQLKRKDNKIVNLSMSNLTGNFKEPSLYDHYVGRYRDLKSS
ncbi:uncharacterized protein LOC134269670 [Saccostrea cucullata]|uniref:uncharacterized protein LOC134269670 n=1 Tax=Saccostrea cuccullata TaxID=36930 RepID=UPI002ED6586D